MIYFIQEVGWFRNRVKIGTSGDLKKRLQTLRATSSSKLKVVLVLQGAYETEAIYHERFAKYRLHGEWFRLGFQLRLFLWLNKYKSLKLNNDIMSGLKSEELVIIKRFKVYVESLDGNKPTWRQATIYSFNNNNSYGSHYTNKLRDLLDKVAYDYRQYLPDGPSEDISLQS